MDGGLPSARGRAPATRGGLPRRVGAHEIVGVLGMSAANEVLLATTRGPHGFVRPVVVKRVRDPDPHDPAASNALVREALAYSRLNHPAVVQLYEVIEDDDRLALILEYVPGAALSRLRMLLARRGEVLEDACTLHIMTTVFAALAAAHEARDPWTGEFVPVVHRDVNPNNVLVSWDGIVKLTDFGIARVTGVASDTRVGLLKGTYGYMAPEQVLGEAITPRTDVYSACLMLRELLLGRPAFTRRGRHELELMQEMAEPRLEPVEQLRGGVPPMIAGALRMGLEPNPDARTITAAEMRDVLGAYVRHEGRERLATLLGLMRQGQGGDESGPQEQSATTGQLEAMPAEGRLSSMTTEPDIPTVVRTSDCVPPEAFRPTVPSLSSLQRDTPQAMVHAILPATRPPHRSHLGSWVLAACFALCVGATLALARWNGPAKPVAAAAPAVSAPPAPPPPSHDPGVLAPSVRRTASASATPVPAPVPATASASSGDLVTPALPDSHRVFVDGRVLGVSGDRIRVPCGPHQVQIGSRGRPQTLLVPCGGQQVVQASW
jgi:eukaryotic-like serine/threonine-protein kinase